MPNYVFKAYMHYDVRPSDDWSTELEYPIDAEVDDSAITNVADAWVDGLIGIEFNNVVVDRVVVSTWEQDSEIYDPDTLRTISYGVFGTIPFIATNPVGDDLALFIRKDVSTGRTGKIQLRGCLTVAMVTSESGSWTLLPAALTAINERVAALWDHAGEYQQPALIGASLLDTIYAPAAAGEKQKVTKVYADVPTVRLVSGLTTVGPKPRQVSQ